MTRQDAINFAKSDIKQYNCEAYAVWHYDNPSAYLMYVLGQDYDPELDYDYAIFKSTDELRNFINHQYGYDYLDRGMILCCGDRITDVYSTKKLIIL